MKKIINRKVYNTETAELLGKYWNGLGNDDFNYLHEELYITKKGSMFLCYSGGALSKYGESGYGCGWGTEGIIPLEPEEAYEWLEKNDCHEAIEKYFADKLEEA
ncbi:hypothetical protein SAMN05660462_01515 [Proteiniborus ethanoligenes]|jgi:hypothetical protein|uniref:Uncharacterized protein n=1 Tax=Proteiniborus ethanoligenes TaxID=415015 RepID=A0A1H3PHJ0_9FIRM|nr:hypothetical protein [Proteiniborus ethanoligenes]SDZ00521.1 hypothetical protein SAMN05660462_01515 [Proteiniborus ethanoligenes]